MHAPQIIIIVFLAVNGTISLIKHGEPKGNYNFFAYLFDLAITVGLLKWGGFFN